jgi:hypothetical protein
MDHKREEERLDQLAGALREGRISEAEAAELRQLLQSHAGARRRFTEHMFLAAALKVECNQPSSMPRTGWRDERHERLHGWTWFAAGVALAAAVLLPVVVVWSGRYAPRDTESANSGSAGGFVDQGVAVLAEAVDARWADDGIRACVGASLPKGRLKLEKGWARIDFYSGASIVLQGGADLELVSPMESILHGGAIRAQVPSHAHGFVVHSPELKLVDLGTSFGMRVDAEKGTEVHVFEGKVQLHDSASGGQAAAGQRELTSGTALRIARDGSSATMKPDANKFTARGDLQRRSDAGLQDRLRNWQAASAALAKDPRLIAYYPFARDLARPGRLVNDSVTRDEAIAGSIVGCSWSQGRWPGKDALEFKRPGDRVRITLPVAYESLTLMAWVRPDSVDNCFASLLLSDGWGRRGAVHWQLMGSHRLSLSVWNRHGVNPDVRSRPILDPYDLGRWMHLAAVYDGRKHSATQYRNGQPIGTRQLPDVVPVCIGPAEIGNWSTLDSRDQTPIRNFNGRIDELAVFSAALEASEIQEIYETGKP